MSDENQKEFSNEINYISSINKTNRIIFKIMWFLFFLISFGFNLKLIIDSINNYLLYETITEISIYSEQPGNENNY